MTAPTTSPALLHRLATTPGEMNDLDDSECIEGYWDGRENDPAPGPNRTDSYAQGWWAGMRDGGHRDYHPIDHDITKAWFENNELCNQK